MIDLYLIRHAESTGNLNTHLIGGRSNHLPITKRGKRQAEALRERLNREEICFDEIYCSPALRTVQTMQIAIPNYESREIVYSEALLELDRGDWTEKKREEISSPEVIERMNREGWNFRSLNGESGKDVAERVYGFVEKIIAKNENKRIAIFSHGYAIKALFTKIFNLDKKALWRIKTENASITQLVYDNQKRWWAERVNDYAHVRGI